MKKFLLLALLSSLSAQAPEWRQYTNGNWIKAFAQKGDTVFIGTSGGILVYDKMTGNRAFLNRANSGLPAADVSALLVDRNGDLWAGTARAGLARRSGSGWTVYDSVNSPLPGNYVTALAADSAGNLWVGTSPLSIAYQRYSGGGVARFDGGSLWSVWRKSNSPLPDSTLRDVEIDSAGNAWIATPRGLARFDGDSTWALYLTSTSQLPQDDVRGLAFDASGRLWAATSASGSHHLSRYEGDTAWTVFQPPQAHQFFLSVGLSLSYDKTRDAFWMGSDEGLLSFDGDSTWSVWDTGNSTLPLPRLNAVCADAEGDIWGGLTNTSFQGAGLFRFDGDSGFSFPNASNAGLLHNRVTSLASQGDGTLWVLTDGIGVLKFDRKTAWDTLRALNGGIWQGISKTIALDNTGRPWVGTSFNGLLRWEGNATWRNYLSSSSVPAIAALSNGKVYAGVGYPGNGLARFNSFDTLSIVYDSINSKFKRWEVLSLLEDKSDILWIGAADSGLIRLAPDSTWLSIRELNDSLDPTFDAIEAMALDSAGGLWVYANYFGTARISTSTFALGPHFNEKNSPVPRAGVNCLAADGKGSLWVGTSQGLFRRSQSGQWDTYTTANSGLADNAIQSLSVDVEGNLWIGTVYGGLCVFGENGVRIAAESAIPAAGPALNLSVFPNPLRGGAVISYALPRASALRIAIYDAAGRSVARLFKGRAPAGTGRLSWNGRGCPAGIYFVKLSSDQFSAVKKMAVIK